ncbi:hypothetical protein XaplCFBP3123_07445 [Xanthomonas arboricola pv. populi]|nr:hypothetical protein XaplCFBP3123_07445 [Xanthomonas arboricola pv. populi]
MQALSQLSYGPTMLRAGDHSDIDDAWEVVRAKKVCSTDSPAASIDMAPAFASSRCVRASQTDQSQCRL